jgi:hypothetical protein
MAGLVVALATALSLMPGVGHATHNTCTAQGSSDPNNHVTGACPEFSPGWTLDVRYPFRDTRADVNLEMSQADHESNALAWEWYLPAEWRFNTGIRPAGGAPTSCSNLFNANGSILNAEPVSDGLGMSGMVTASNGNRTARYWGRFRVASSNNALRAHNEQLAYWRTVGDTTTLCALLQTSTTGSISPLPNKVIFPITLQRGDFGGGSGWKVSVPVESIHAQMAAYSDGIAPDEANSADFSLTALDLELDGLTGGKWHLENGVPTRTTFSRAPRNPIQTEISTRAIACTNGANTLALCADENEIAFPYTGLREFPFSVMLPPVYQPTPWASITRAGDTTLAGTGRYYEKPVKGFGFSQDTDELSVTWNALTPAALPAGVTAAGYVLAAHKVTPQIQPTTAAEIAAGRVLFERDFSNTATRAISFDLTDMAANQIDVDNDGDADASNVDGKYNVSLVTVYNTPYGNGYRSDGMCDGPSLSPPVADNGQGVLCPADRPLWMASGAARDDGTSLYQIIVREDAWPQRYLYSVTSQPFAILLLDLPNRRAEYTIWGAPAIVDQTGDQILYSIGQGIADQGPSTVFRGTSDLMYGNTAALPGVVSFGNLDLESEGFTWNVTVAIDSELQDADGQFTMYNARGGDLDWLKLTVPSGDPASFPDQILGDVQDQEPSGAPQVIMGDFGGVAF